MNAAVSWQLLTLSYYFIYSFMITDLVYNGEGGEYLVNLNMSVCLESRRACNPIIPVLVNTILPKGVCNRNHDFRDKGFVHCSFLLCHRYYNCHLFKKTKFVSLIPHKCFRYRI